jgi:chromosomal replication initiation ATPase DnaA
MIDTKTIEMVNTTRYAGVLRVRTFFIQPITVKEKSLMDKEAEAMMIIRHVFKQQKIDPALYNLKSRKREIVCARQICIHLINKYLALQSTHMGRLFGLDHSTILYNVGVAEDILFTDRTFKKAVLEIEKELRLRKEGG